MLGPLVLLVSPAQQMWGEEGNLHAQLTSLSESELGAVKITKPSALSPSFCASCNCKHGAYISGSNVDPVPGA